MFYGIVGLTGRVRIPGAAVLMPTVGGLLVGLLALGIPQILSSGYGWVQFATQTSSLMTIPLWIVLVLPVAKIVATSLSIGTGGSGVIFGPGVGIGAFFGLALDGQEPITENPRHSRGTGRVRRRRHDGLFRQRRTCTVGGDDHGCRDVGLVFDTAGGDDLGRYRLPADEPHVGVDLRGPAE